MGKLVDRKGQRYGRLVVVMRAPTPEFTSVKNAYWLCRCDCGNYSTVSSASLVSGAARSCGCLRREIATEHMREVGRRSKKLMNDEG